MSSRSARVPAPLHLLLVVDREQICDPTRLVAAFGHDLDVTIGVSLPVDERSTATVLAAADAIDELGRCGVRARYLELCAPMAQSIAEWIEATPPRAERLVVVDAGVGARRIRALRRSLRGTRIHLGVLPVSGPEQAVAT